MTSVPPHLYRKHAPQDLDPAIVDRALHQLRAVEINGIPGILSLRHLAYLTKSDYLYLRSITSRQTDAYRTFTIRKRSGGGRLIAAPQPELMALQRWVSKEVLANVTPHVASHAYARKSSPLKCAKLHVGATWLIKVDIHDFFESITERRVFFAFREMGYQPLVAFELARICTRVKVDLPLRDIRFAAARRTVGIKKYNHSQMGYLPQGAPTSPMLANLVSFEMDRKLTEFGAETGLTYTRYSDDLIFSSARNLSHRTAETYVAVISRIINSFGHDVHRRKTTIAPPGARKVVLGLLVDDTGVRLQRETRDRAADHVRGIEKFGLAAHATERHFASLWGMVRHIHGLLKYMNSVQPEIAGPLLARLEAVLAREKWQGSLYDNFWLNELL